MWPTQWVGSKCTLTTFYQIEWSLEGDNDDGNDDDEQVTREDGWQWHGQVLSAVALVLNHRRVTVVLLAGEFVSFQYWDGRGKIISASEHKPSIHSRFWEMYIFPKLFSSYPCFHGALLVLAGLQVERLCKSRHRSDRTDKSTHRHIHINSDKDKDTETKTHTQTQIHSDKDTSKDTQTHIHTQVTWLGLQYGKQVSTTSALSLASFDNYCLSHSK